MRRWRTSRRHYRALRTGPIPAWFLSVLMTLVVLAGFLLDVPPPAHAHGPTLRFERLSVEDGLSTSKISHIFQDSQGFMWFGTNAGLNKYDGYTFTIYEFDPDDATSISDNEIHVIYEDQDGTVWVGTRNGLNRYDRVTGTFTRYYHDPEAAGSISDDYVAAMHEDATGTLWFSTIYGGVNRFDQVTGTFEAYAFAPDISTLDLSYETGTTLYEDRAGTLWVGNSAGLFRLDHDTRRFVRVIFDAADPQRAVYDMCEDHEGNFWLGTNNGLYQYDRSTQQAVVYQHDPDDRRSLSHNQVLALHEDRSGTLWLGTNGGGLSTFERTTETFTRYINDPSNPHSLSGDIVSTLFEDRTGIMWIGTGGGGNGINIFNPATRVFEHYTYNEHAAQSFSTRTIATVYPDSAGTLWLGGYDPDGLNRFDRSRQAITIYRHEAGNSQSLPHDSIYEVFEDQAGMLWIGTLGGGLAAFDREQQTFTSYQHDPARSDSLSNNVVPVIYEDRAGTLWVGTEDGLNVFDRESQTFRAYFHDSDDPRSLSHSEISAIYEDQAGNLWIGTWGGGINRFDRATETFQRYVHAPEQLDSISDNRVYWIAEDKPGNLWIGTKIGLNRFSPGSATFTHYTEKDGLPSNGVLCVLPDTSGYLWLSTGKGLARLNPVTETFHTYADRDGLLTNDFNGGACARSSQGELFFGSQNGFVAFDPQRVLNSRSQHTPPVVLTGFYKLNEPFDPGQDLATLSELQLSYRDRVISFEFAALDYADPERNQYVYKLDGFDQDWIQANNQRSATYTNLDGGNYVFRVKAANSSGVWNDEGVAVDLDVTAPPWQTWWAYSLYTIGLIGFVGGYVRYRTQAQARELAQQRRDLERERLVAEELRRVDRLKNEFIANTSHELRTPLNGIIGIAESLIERADGNLTHEQQTNLSLIAASGRRLSNLVNDILDFSRLQHRDLHLRPRPIDIQTITNVVLMLSQPLVGNKPLKLMNRIPSDIPAVDADEQRVQQILYNLVGNAIKFTEAGMVAVSAEVREREVAITVADTGVGIPREQFDNIFKSFEQVDGGTVPASAGTGLGLAITRQLVELHGGTIQVESMVGQGSAFTFTLPVSPEPALPHREMQPVPSLYLNEPAPPVSNAPAANETVRVLIVDDEPVNLHVLTNYLTPHNYAVTQMSSGTEVLQAFEHGQQFDIVLLDVMMPRMSGYQVCQTLRTRYPAHQLPVIMLTARNQTADLVAGFEAGANDYLGKPFSREELLMRMQTHLHLAHVSRDLAQLSTRLEDLVAERTAALSETNRTLQTEIAERRRVETERTQLLADIEQQTLALRKSQLMLREFIENAPALIHVRDTQGCFMLINHQYASVMQCASGDVIGKTPYDLVAPEIAAVLLAYDQQILATRRPVEYEQTIPWEDGTHTYISVGFPLHDAQGQVYAVGGISADITRQKHVEQEQQRLYRVSEGLRDVLAVINSDRSLDEVLHFIVCQATRLLDVDVGVIYRFLRSSNDEITETFRVEAAQGFEDNYQGILIHEASLTICYDAIQSRQPVAIHDMTAVLDNLLTNDSLGADYRRLVVEVRRRFRATLVVPLIIKGEVYGTISLYNSQARQFVDEEINLAVTFASQSALAIENAHLRQQVRLSAVREERGRLARELHDSVTQSLYSLTLLSEGWRLQAQEEQLGQVELHFARLGSIANQALKEMRLLIYQLRPSLLEEEGLVGAIQRRLEVVEHRSGIQGRVLVDGMVDLPSAVEDNLYRIVQEALNNSLKHAAARCVTVSIRCLPPARNPSVTGQACATIEVTVTDDGQGFDPDEVVQGVGMDSMQERIKQLGGSFAIHSAPQRGTTVRVYLEI